MLKPSLIDSLIGTNMADAFERCFLSFAFLKELIKAPISHLRMNKKNVYEICSYREIQWLWCLYWIAVC
jgi:hypothetical protein